jgi:hypothetical protein
MSGNKELAISLSIIGVILLIILGFTFLPDMIKEWKRKASIVDFKQEETYIVDENGNKFYMLNNCIEAMAKTGLYGRLDGVEYYYITKMGKEGEKPQFIVEYLIDSIGFVYGREDAEKISLNSFTPISADICLGATDYPIDYLVAHDKYLENGGNIIDACRYANAVGAYVVTKPGAFPSLPTAKELESFTALAQG